LMEKMSGKSDYEGSLFLLFLFADRRFDGILMKICA